MPKRNKFRKRTKKYKARVIKPIPLIAEDIYLCKLRYSEAIIFDATGINQIIFRGNGVFDPNFTGSGQQPVGYDQLATLYDRTRVLSSAIEVKWSAGTSGTTSFADVVIVPVIASGATFSTIDAALSNPYAKSGTITGTDAVGWLNMHSFMTTKKMIGRKSIKYDDAYTASLTSNPDKQWFWFILAELKDRSATAMNIRATIVVTYYVEWYDRKPLNLS